MHYDDEEYDPYAGFNDGCPIHGEDYMRECTVCGAEFCTLCFPNSGVCEECAEQGADLDDEEEFGDGDADEMKIVEELAPDDPELDKETEAALLSFGDFEDESAPTDDVLQKAEQQKDAVAKAAAKAAKTAKKPAAKSAAKPTGKKAAAPSKGRKAAPKAKKK